MSNAKKKKQLHEQLRRDAESRKAMRDTLLHGIGFLKGGKHVALQDMLRNVNRTATRALDEAGVPDHLQGASEEDWDLEEREGRFDDF